MGILFLIFGIWIAWKILKVAGKLFYWIFCIALFVWLVSHIWLLGLIFIAAIGGFYSLAKS